MNEEINKLTSVKRMQWGSLVLVASVLSLVGMGWQAIHSSRHVATTHPHHLRLQELSGRLHHLHEVQHLTVHLGVATADPTWATLHRQQQPKLTQAIDDAGVLAVHIGGVTFVERVRIAHLRLELTETKALALAAQARGTEARVLLVSPDYRQQQREYAAGMGDLTASLEQTTQQVVTNATRRALLAVAVAAIAAVLLVVAWLIAIYVLNRWRLTIHQDRAILEQQTASLQQTREQLQQSESRFRGAFAASAVGIALVSPDGRWFEVNPALTAILGYTEAELLATTFQELTHPDDLAISLEYAHKLQSGELPHYQLEKRYLHKDGHSLPIHLSVSLVRDNIGKPLYQVAMIKDISERKAAEQERERFFGHSLTPMCIVGFDGRLKAFNSATMSTFGYSREELMSQSYLDFIHPADRERTENEISCVTAGSVSRQFEVCSQCKDGSYKWTVWETTPCSEQQAFYAIGHDVTARHHAEAALAESERFTRSTLDALTAHIVILDEQGVIIATNKTWRKFACENQANTEVGVGANYLDVCDAATGSEAEDAAAMAAGIRTIISGAEHEFILEYPCHSPTEKRWFLARVTRFEEAGPLRCVISHENITVAKLADEERQKFVSLVENSIDFIGLATLTGEAIYMNPAACKMVGLRSFPDEAGIATRISDFNTDEGNRVFHEFTLPAIAEKGSWEGEMQFRQLQSGAPIDMHSSVFLVRHPSTGDPLCMATVSHDITEQKRQAAELHHAQAVLLHEEQRFRSLVEASSAIVWNTPASGEFEADQPGWSKYTGQSFEQLQGWGWLDAVHPDDIPLTREAWSTAIANRSLYQVEHRLRRYDGNYRYMMVRAVPVMNADQSIHSWVGIHTDIEDLKQAEAAQREAREIAEAANRSHREQLEELEQLYDSAPIGLQLLDKDFRILRINERLATINGKSVQAHLGQTLREMVPQYASTIEANVSQVFETGKPQLNIEMHGACSSDPSNEREWLVSYYPVQSPHNKPRFVGVVVLEITELKRVENELLNNQLRLREQQAVLVRLTRTGRQEDRAGSRLHLITETSARILGASRVTLWRYSADQQRFRCTDQYESSSGLHTPGDELNTKEYPAYFHALDDMKIIDAEDALNDPRTQEFVDSYFIPLGITATLDAPIHLNGEVQGVICHEYRDSPKQWAADEQTFAVAIANLIALEQERQQREQLELDLRSKTAFLQAQTESTHDGLLVVDEQRTVILKNRQFNEMWQLPEEMTEQDSDEATLNYVMNLVKQPETFLERMNHLYGNNEETCRELIELNDGRFFDRFSAPVLGKDDHYYGRIWAFRDITERIRNEQQLRLQSAALEAAANGIVITDKQGTIEWVNSAFSRMTGYSLGQAKGQNPRILKSGQQNEAFYHDLWDTVLRGEVWSGEITNKRKDGSLYPVEMSIAPVFENDGQISHFVAITQDITARREAHAQLFEARNAADEANHAKSEFLANMSHEIRTPMNGIIGLTALALEAPLDAEQRQYLDSVLVSAESLLKLINSILNFSKIEAGKWELENINFRLRETLETALQPFLLPANEKQLKLQHTVRPDVPDALIGDSARLWQVLVNLVSNALKFTEQGEIEVLIERETPVTDEVTLRFTVRDTGIGIPEDKQAMLFQPFTQADSSTTRHYGGTGLGLAISARLVKLMGGQIWLESEPGTGTQFHFTARFECQPVVLPEEVPAALETATGLREQTGDDSASQAPALPRPLHILVVEDSPINQLLARRTLEKAGYSVVVANNGQEALAALEKSTFDLILMDVQMPLLDGYQTTARIREQELITGQHMPIVAMTAHAVQGDREKCLAAGMDSYVSKPFRKSDLFDAINEVMQGSGHIR